jgi:hypothetical protein
MTLYRLNLNLSQEVFTILSCFEVAVINAIDRILTERLGENWLRDAVLDGGIFDVAGCRDSAKIINKAYIFNELDGINILRNRIAHHEPICFARHQPEIGTSYILNAYQTLHKLFMWMGIDSHSLLYGLDHVQRLCSKINRLKSHHKFKTAISSISIMEY